MHLHVHLNRVSAEASEAGGAGARNLRAVGIAWAKISRDVRRIRPSVRSGRLARKMPARERSQVATPRKTRLHKVCSEEATHLFVVVRWKKKKERREREKRSPELSFDVAAVPYRSAEENTAAGLLEIFLAPRVFFVWEKNTLGIKSLTKHRDAP